MPGTARILVYHSIQTDRDFPSSARTNVPPDLFERQLKHLRECYTMVSLDEAVNGESRAGKHPLAITFDDGYEDSYKRASPVLKKYGLPSTFFLTVSQIGKSWDFPQGLYPGLSWEQVKEMDRDHLITIGSHGYGHKELDLLAPEDAANDIKASKAILEEKLDHPISYFSYPHGSFNEQIKKYVQEFGFRAAFGVVSCGGDRFSLPRILISRKDNMFRFRLKLSPLYWPLRYATARWRKRLRPMLNK